MFQVPPETLDRSGEVRALTSHWSNRGREESRLTGPATEMQETMGVFDVAELWVAVSCVWKVCYGYKTPLTVGKPLALPRAWSRSDLHTGQRDEAYAFFAQIATLKGRNVTDKVENAVILTGGGVVVVGS